MSRTYGEQNSGEPIEALVGYGLANESYSSCAKALPSLEQISLLRHRLVAEIESRLDLEVSPKELELHLLYEWSQGE